MVGGGPRHPWTIQITSIYIVKLPKLGLGPPCKQRYPPPPQKKSKLVSVDDTVVNVWINLNLNILTFKRMMTSSPVLVPHYRIVLEERLNMWTFECQLSSVLWDTQLPFLVFVFFAYTKWFFLCFDYRYIQMFWMKNTILKTNWNAK